LVNHGHFKVNNVPSDIPSMLLRPGDIVEVRERSVSNAYFKEVADLAEKRPCAMWIERDLKNMSGRVVRLPERSEIDGALNEQLIVEYYSR